MQLVLCTFVVILAAGSAGTHCRLLIQNKQFKTVLAQALITALAVTGAVAVIYRFPVPSVAKIMLSLIPW
ncbi:hypothetical protein [Paenibacillus piri]|uniref:Uncharacterized protein n=1 Tax=Paenibacillus piri TaxID=2547395 RepID=A0A4R5KRF8_9BACL|nr:hypothetical protein [Paenibacillus piri]TDF97972.1 hypothetical protein E1757_10660 [Paenibacillus piri]